MRALGLEMFEREIFKTQQYRSQALSENVRDQFSPHDSVEERKQALYKKIEKANLSCETSIDFLDKVGELAYEHSMSIKNGLNAEPNLSGNEGRSTDSTGSPAELGQ